MADGCLTNRHTSVQSLALTHTPTHTHRKPVKEKSLQVIKNPVHFRQDVEVRHDNIPPPIAECV